MPPQLTPTRNATALHRQLVTTYQWSLGTPPGQGLAAAGERAITELLADLEPLLRWLVDRVAEPSDDRDELRQLAHIAAERAARTWRANGGASPSTWITTYVTHALAPDKRQARRLDKGRVRLSGLDDPGAEVSVHLADVSEIGRVSAHVRAACQSLPDRLAAHVMSTAASVAAGSCESLGSRASRSVAVRCVLAHPAMGLRPLLNDTPGWWDDATCLGMPLRSYFPSRGEAIDPGVATRCQACPVRSSCLSEALEDGLRAGYRGGLSAKARRQSVATARGNTRSGRDVCADNGPCP